MPTVSMETKGNRIAMLIDGDNAQPSLLGEIIAEAGKYGQVTIRNIYGDWTTTNMNSWKDSLNVHSIQPVQQFRYTIGKNATDSSMIIDAMDILYEGIVTGFCLVSSDSDYTGLARRIRKQGLFVMGIGRQSTPKAFVNACEVFVFTEILGHEEETLKTSGQPRQAKSTEAGLAEALLLIKKALDKSVQEDGWAHLSAVGAQLRQLDPSFDARTYGFGQLSQMVTSFTKEFEVRKERSRGPSPIYIKLKDERT
jgi:hypothetical protein